MMAAGLRKTHDGFLLSPEDHPSIGLRRKRNGSVGADTQRCTRGDDGDTDTSHPWQARQGIATPPSTPHRTKKRVRFSEPNPISTTGLTPFLGRSSLSSPPPSRSRRHSTPAARWNLALDDTPIICQTLQFASLRQVLDGKVKRRIRRNRLSEEVNSIEAEKKSRKKAQAAENEFLKEELRKKNQQIEELRNERDLVSQIGGEAGIEPLNTSYNSEKIKDLELQVTKLRNELHNRKVDAPTWDEPNLALGEEAIFDNDEDETFLRNCDDEFNAEMTDIFHSTPTRRSFPSPPATLLNTPSKSSSPHVSDCEASASEIERLHLESQLKSLQEELKTLKRTLELSDTTRERLTTKLAPYITESPLKEEAESLDAALDAVLTRLALSESATLESSSRFSALSDDLSDFFSSQSANPESILQQLHMQFRSARLELEYLTPGENTEGFENSKLLDMLISRIKVLTVKVQQQDADIDQYHSQETSLRQQLGARIDAMDHLQKMLTTATSEVARLESDIHERDESISKLTHALQGYRDEVSGLESLVNHLEVEHAADSAILCDDIESTKRDADAKLRDLSLKTETLEAAAEGREMLMRELEKRLSGALASARALEDAFAALQEENYALHSTAAEQDKAHKDALALQDAKVAELFSENGVQREAAIQREKAHGNALALRDARVAELREEIERNNEALKRAHDRIVELERENHDLRGQVEGEKARALLTITSMQSNAARLISDGDGFKKGHVAVLGPHSDSQNTDIGAAFGGATSQTVAHATPEPLLSASYARRRSMSVGKGKKRRRYDSGLGFLDEEDEVEEDSACA